MLQQVIHRSFLWLVSISAILIVGIIGCGADDDNDWGGTWSLETIDGENLVQDFAKEFGEDGLELTITANEWTFSDDGTIEAAFGMKFELKEQGLEVSGQGSMKMMGTYSLSGSNYTLTIIEVETTGVFQGSVELTVPTGGDTGTWSRSGNTLTLNSDGGNTIVFKKK